MVSTPRRRPSAALPWLPIWRNELSCWPFSANSAPHRWSASAASGRRRPCSSSSPPTPRWRACDRESKPYRVDLLVHLVEHLAEVLEELGARIFFGLRLVGFGTGVDVAQGGNVFAGAGIGVAAAFAADSHAGDVQLAVEILAAQKRRHAKREGPGCQRTRFDEVAPIDWAGA